MSAQDFDLRKIAIVDATPALAREIQAMLIGSGYEVCGIHSRLRSLLDSIDTEKPQLVLMDMQIEGGTDELEAARLLRERHRIPIVFIVDQGDETLASHVRALEPFGFLHRPLSPAQLATSLGLAFCRADMEKRLLESEERYRLLFNEGISANFLADASYELVDANPAFRRLVGLGDEDPLPDMVSLFFEAADWELFRAALASARRIELRELRLRGPEGRGLVVLANAAAHFDGAGAFAGLRGELIDISERRLLEERMAQAQKMEAIGQLAGGIAHDFNNILTAIMGYGNLLAEELVQMPEARADLDGIKKAAQRASDLTRKLLGFARAQKAVPRVVDFGAVVAETLPMIARLLADGIDIVFTPSALETRVLADPTGIEQIVMNLALNARDAMQGSGLIRMTTRNESLRARRRIGGDDLDTGAYVVLDVRDSGHGIAAELMPRLFDPFFTTKSKEKGTGLGLATVYTIVRQAGGAIAVESSPGAGACFSVWLPLAAAKGGPASAAPASAAPADAAPADMGR